MTKAGTIARLKWAFENVETMTRQQLIDFCQWNDPNGSYTDEAVELEFPGEPLGTVEELREIVRAWRDEG
jgi:hypothetical protein